MPQSLISGLETAAKSQYAFVAYICLIAAWVYVVVAQSRLKRISKAISLVPAEQRGALLSKEYNVFPRSGLSAEQWIRSRRHTLFFIGFLALVVAALIVIVVAMTLRNEIKIRVSSKPIDWQMYLYLGGVQIVDGTEKVIATRKCDEESRNKTDINDPLVLPRNSYLELAAAIRLVVDNVFPKHQNMIYPIGLSTTWDRRVFTVYDGQDVQAYREGLSSKFVRDFDPEVTLRTPDSPGLHYILIMSGATMTPRQLFTASVDETETAESIWNTPFANFSGKVCGGYLAHSFVHTNGDIEKANWPIIAVPVRIE